jgi:hypothetical protein
MRAVWQAFFAAALIASNAQSARAQTDMVRVRGTIDAVDPGDLQVTTNSGEKLTITLADDAKVTLIVPIAIDAIKPGAFIGTAAVEQPDGTLKALEVHVLPEASRGAGEGHRPWDLGPASSMTNGTIGDVKVADGRHLTLTYKDGEQKVFVPEGVPIVTFEPGARQDLKPGTHVFVFAKRGADGALSASRISVGKDGLTPPM